MLFIVAAAVALHTLLFYKAQSVTYIMLPTENLENTINKYIVVAFLLKVKSIIIELQLVYSATGYRIKTRLLESFLQFR